MPWFHASGICEMSIMCVKDRNHSFATITNTDSCELSCQGGFSIFTRTANSDTLCSPGQTGGAHLPNLASLGLWSPVTQWALF